MTDAGALLEVCDLTVAFDTDDGRVHAVNGVSFTADVGESVAIVGESGSGKSVTALSILGLLPPGHVRTGAVRYRGRDLTGLSEREMRDLRGRELALVPQDPMTSLNPVLTVGSQLTGVIRHHTGLGRKQARNRATEMLGTVGIPNPRGRLDDYPHQFSGGQRQRVLIALALCTDPSVLIADEPTTALDVTIQAQIIELVTELRSQLSTTVLWITHDLGVVAGMVDRVIVMYGGLIAERGQVRELFHDPRHPYTRGLLHSLPDSVPGQERLTPIEGTPPNMSQPVTGCPFAPRCALAEDRCRADVPALLPVTPAHDSACLRRDELPEFVAAAGREAR